MGKQVRKQKKSSIVAGGFLRFGLYVCVIIAVVYIGKSAFDFGYAIFNQVPWQVKRMAGILLSL